MASGAGAAQTIQYVHTGHLGTPVLTTDANGAAVAPGNYSVIGFPGQTRTFADLYYNRYRDYDPSIGRYLQADPIGLEGGANSYAYAGNNAMHKIDPRGLAYFAYRGLDFGGYRPWFGPLSNNPIDNYFNTALAHQQLFFEDGKSPPNIGFFADSSLRTDPNPTGYHRLEGHYDDCIMRKAVANVPLSPYHLFGNNCQKWIDMVLAEYSKLMADPSAKKSCECSR